MAVREMFLRVGLTASYLLVVTPLRWAIRLAGWQPLAMRPDRSVSSYWIPLRLDSSARVIYEMPKGTGLLAEIRSLLGTFRELGTGAPVWAKQIIMLFLLALKPMAREPHESEISSDLYVMF